MTKKALAEIQNKQKQFEEQILAHLEIYQKNLLEMVGPWLEKTIEDKKELNREKIKALIQAPSAFGVIK